MSLQSSQVTARSICEVDDREQQAPTLGHPLSLPSAKADRKSMLDLPQTILEDIVAFLRYTLRYDGYLCELRLVNRRVNEAVLYILSCQGFLRDSKDFPQGFSILRSHFPLHYTSCPTRYGSCHRMSCMTVGICNPSYARYLLQAKIQLSRANIPSYPHVWHYGTLTTALDLLHKHLKSEDGSLPVATSLIQHTSRFRNASSNPIFSDQLSTMFCEGTLVLLGMVTSDWQRATSTNHHLSNRSPWFWLRNLACFLGDIELFDFYCAQAPLDGNASTNLFIEHAELLAITARQGHEALFHHILHKKLLRQNQDQQLDLELALKGAHCSGNVRIVSLILQVCPAEIVGGLCSATLANKRGSPRQITDSLGVAEQIVGRCDEISTERLCGILATQAELGASSVVRLLLSRYPNCTFWPPPGPSHQASFTAFWAACVNSDIHMVRILLRHGYFTSTENARQLWPLCMSATVQANAFAICQEVCKFVGMEIHELSLGLLAGMDGTVEAMTLRLEIHPDELSTKLYGKATVGEDALENAAALLRVENTKFLLGRGVRFIEKPWLLSVEWRRKRANEQKYLEVQKLLQEYGQRQLEVEL